MSSTAADTIVFIDRPDWHARQLAAAFAKAGVQPAFLPLRKSGFSGAAGGARLSLPPPAHKLPAGVFVRTIPAGSFEQVTLRLGVLHALREAGVLVYNDARAIERCVDKSMTSFLLDQAGIPTPPTWTVETLEAARAIVRSEASPRRPMVLKPLFGSQGRGLQLVASEADLPTPEIVASVYYLQHFVADGTGRWRDWRIFVVGDRAVAAMIRHGVTWKTNASQGANCEAVDPSGEMAALAVAATRAVGASYAGIDVIRDAAGRLLVLEVNSNPAWSALQQVTRPRIAEMLVANFLSRLPAPLKQRETEAAALSTPAG